MGFRLIEEAPAAAGRFRMVKEEPREKTRAPSQRGTILDPLVGQGILMGFGDEMKAGVRAGARRLFGNSGRSYSELYDDELGGIRSDLEGYRERHPTASTVAEMAGAVATIPYAPGGAATRGARLGERLLRGARTGAGYGAAYGFGSGEGVEDRVTGALTGAAGGAVVGAAAPVAIEGVIQAGRGAAALNPLRGVVSREGAAARRVARDLSNDAGGPQNVPARLATVRRAQQQGFPSVVADAGGESTRALARSAANQSPEARAALQEVTQRRFEQQGDRTSAFLRSLVGESDSVVRQDQLRVAARQVNDSAYELARRAGDRPLWSPTLERLTSSPAVVEAMRNAGTRGQNRAVARGSGGFNAGVTIDPSGIVTFQRGRNGVPTYPNLEYWDVVRRELRDMRNAASRQGRNEEAGAIGELAGHLNGELDRLVPSYQTARRGAAEFFGAEDALEAGQRFVTASLNNGEARRAINRMSAPERELFAEGYVSELINRIRGVRDRSAVLDQAFIDSSRAREQTLIALGPQRARQVESFLRVEQILDVLRREVSGNSTTTRQLLESGLAGGASGGLAFVGPDATQGNYSVSAMVALAAAGTRYGINRQIARRVGEMLASDDPQRFLQGLNAVARNRRLMDFVRSFHTAVTRIATPPSGQPLRVYLSAGERDKAYANEEQRRSADQEQRR